MPAPASPRDIPVPQDQVATALPLPPAAPPAPAEPAAPPEDGPRVVVRTAANLRATPHNGATVLRTVPQGEVLREFGRSRDGWVEVGDTKPQGWIYSKLLAPAKP